MNNGPECNDAINTYTLTLGRNKNVHPFYPLSNNEWLAFKDGAEMLLRRFLDQTGAWIETKTRHGEWEGVTEESVTVTLLGGVEFDTVNWPLLAQDVVRLAEAFNQDAIAFANGTSRLIHAFGK